MITNACAIPQIIITGKLCDMFKPKYTIPLAFLWQICAMAIYIPVKDPSSWAAYVCAVFQDGSGNIFVIAT